MFPYTITDKAVTVFIDGQPRTVPASHGSYNAIKESIMANDWDEVRLLSDVKKAIAVKTFGRVQILDTEIQVDGRVVRGNLVDRILEMVRLGNDAIEGYVKFLDNLMNNPRKLAVDELFLFVEACDLPITPDGCILAYRFVNTEYIDTFSRSVFAKPADVMTDDETAKYSNPVIGGREDEVTTQIVNGVTTVSMPRNMVDDVRERHCSQGLHFCSYNYLPSYGMDSRRRVLVVKINPADVVSIPSDYNNAKGRTCQYQVVNEIENWEDTRISPWYTDEYEIEDDFEDDFEDYFEDDFEDDLDRVHIQNDLDIDTETGEIIDTPEPIDTSDADFSKKLSWTAVRQMRELFRKGKFNLTEIANTYSISRRQAARIRDNESWIE